MFRKLFVILSLLLMLPAFANAWYVNAKTSPVSGQGTITPAGNVSYPTGVNSGEFTVMPAAGYMLSRVTLDGLTTLPNANGKYVAPYVAGKTYRYLVAYFTAGSAINITTAVNVSGGGSVREDTFESLTNIPAGSSRQILVGPNPGYQIDVVTASGTPTITSNPDGSRLYSYSNLSASQSVTASFLLLPVVTVSAGPDVTANGEGAEFATTLNGSASSNQGAITYAWSGSGLSFGSPGSAITTVYAATAGSYTATLTATSGGIIRQDSATVTVLNRTEYLEAQCTACHANNTPQVVADYNVSPHKTKNVSCQDCHTINTPHTSLPTENICMSCHGAVPANHPLAIDQSCLFCHNPHSTVGGMTQGAPHYSNITSAGYPASYVTSRATCADCHIFSDSANAAIRHRWYTSGHANIKSPAWTKFDFKTKGGCVQCHSTTGFIAYSTGKVTAAWGIAADKTKEVLTCKGCHNNVAAGTVRSVTPVRPFADDSYLNRNVGISNICMDCHSGKNSGLSIMARLEAIPAADFTSQAFVAPHYLAAAGSLHGKSGYHFSGQTYEFYSSNSHRLIGIGNYNGSGASGPCIVCHKSTITGHTFRAAVIDICSNCHRTSLSETELQARKSDFDNALNILRAALADKGFVYQANYPYFANQNWGSGQAGANSMGAAFNYALLLREPGAYAHNSAYEKKLITDSIDAAYNNGTVTGNIDSALAQLVNKGVDNGGITQEQADLFQTYRTNSNCTTCHNSSMVGKHSAHLNAAVSCNACHSASAMTNSSLVSGTLAHANGAVDVIFAAGLNGNYDALTGTCSSLYCHSDGTSLASGLAPVGTASWSGVGLSCTSCHGSPPNYVSGVPKANSHSSHNYSCTTCHADTTIDGTSISGSSLHANRAYTVTPSAGISFTYDYAATGGNCSNISCHFNGSAVWGVNQCDGCHDAPPATASHLKHYGGTVAQAQYGDTRVTSSFANHSTSYIFGCGTCHPLIDPDPTKNKHMNGVVDVELYNAGEQAPGSLKKLNPPSASYTAGGTMLTDSRGYPYSNGTCDNVYCHSYKSWTTPTGVSSSTSCAPNAPANLVTTTNYKTVTWGGPTLDCAGCHANPPQTNYYAGNGGAAGDSHSWLSDDFGGGSMEYLHSNNMYWETGDSSPISCMYCHNDTVRQQNSFTRVAEPNPAAPYYPYTLRASLGNVPIYDFGKHVNGANTVAFEKQIAVPTIADGNELTGHGWTGQKLTNASYEPATKTCSNVACHLARTDVKWGTPYKGGVANDCLRCHEDYYGGGMCPDAATADSHQPTIFSAPPTLAAPGYTFSYAVDAAQLNAGTLISTGLSYSLGTHPAGMTISPAGVVTWNPSALGSVDVRVLVSSGGLPTSQDFTISVVAPQVVITSTPVTTATAWSAYTYTVAAKIPSGMPAATYALTTAPAGMAINTSGLITWTPTDSQVGNVPVTATVSSAGNSASQSFTIVMAPSPITFGSSPGSPQLTLPVTYSYDADATKSGGGTISYSLYTKPTGMTINSSTGVLTWIAPSLPVHAEVTIVASSGGYSQRQTFTVVTQLAAPKFAFTSTPVIKAKVGVPYTYTVTGTKYAVGTLSYTVSGGTGLTIGAATGIISWAPTSTAKRSVVVTARIANPTAVAVATQSFDIEVDP